MKFRLVFNGTGYVVGEIEAPNQDAINDMIDADRDCWRITEDGLKYDLEEIEEITAGDA